MSSPQPGTPPISPDGHFWWDGQAWQPMPVPAAAAPAPGQAAPPEQPPSWLAAPPEAAPPVPAEPAVEQLAPVPVWAAPAPPASSRLPTYMGAFALIAIIAIGGFVVYPMLKADSNGYVQVSPSPSPLISDFERADRFLNVDLGPSLVETNAAVPSVNAKCTSSLPPPCKDALITLNKAMIDVDDAIANNQRDIPVCIGRPVQQFKDDWLGMEQGLSMAIGGFTDNNRTLILTGLQKFGSLSKFMKADVDRINQAQQTCSKTI